MNRRLAVRVDATQKVSSASEVLFSLTELEVLPAQAILNVIRPCEKDYSCAAWKWCSRSMELSLCSHSLCVGTVLVAAGFPKGLSKE